MNSDSDRPRHFVESDSTPDASPKVVVVGSINMDLVARMPNLPRPGETVSGDSFQTIPGGKGANQAVAAARLGARVTLIARLGDDSFGRVLRQNLTAEGIDTKFIFDTPGCSSGVALIGVESAGANSIVVVPGANGQLTAQDIESCRVTIEAADVLIVQLETPLETVIAALEIAKQHEVLTVLDPAPAPRQPLPVALLSADVLSPNQTEAEAITGIAVSNWESAMCAALEMRRLGANEIVLKMGELGALVFARDGSVHRIAATPVDVIDTTAAGDAFTAALACTLCNGRTLKQAAHWGVLAGSLACTRFGAQPAMPTHAEVERFAELNQASQNISTN